MNKTMISLSELARLTHKSPSTLREMMEAGVLVPTVRELSGRRRILFDEAAIAAAGLHLYDSGDPEAEGDLETAISRIVRDAVLPDLLDRFDLLEKQLAVELPRSDANTGWDPHSRSRLRRWWRRAVEWIVKTGAPQ